MGSGDLALTILDRVALFVPLLLSLTVHEWAHARSALALGDDTAALAGRCTLSPLPHIDILGTVILPLLGVPFGWAKPVPINPLRFRRGVDMRTGMMLTALAGPASNLILAVISIVLLVISIRLAPGLMYRLPEPVRILELMILVNVALAFFNMMPVPPLDGSRLADYFVPDSLRPTWEKVYGAGPIALIVFIVVLQVTGFRLLEIPLSWVQRLIILMLGG